MNDILNVNQEETRVVKFDVTEAAISEMKELYMGLVITDLDDKEQYDTVHRAHMIVRGKRTSVEKRAKEYNVEALEWQRTVNAKKNHICELIEPIESHLKSEKQKVQDEKDRKENQRIALVQERIRQISALLHDLKGVATVNQLNLVISKLEAMEITPDLFFEFTADAFVKRDQTLESAKQALENRIRLDKEEAERKAEDERLAKVKAEQDKIAAEQKAVQDIIDKQNATITAEYAKLEADKKAEQERKDREEFERKATEQAEKKAKEDAEFERLEKIRVEHEAAEEAERQKALLPDKEKLVAFSQFLIEGITYPEVISEEAGRALVQAEEKIEIISNQIFEKAQNL